MTAKGAEHCILTRSLVWPAKMVKHELMIPVPDGIVDHGSKQKKFVLGIYAPGKDFFKVTSYYLSTPDVTKIIIVSENMNDDIVQQVSSFVNSFSTPPLHVSGFCSKNGKYLYEA
nr:hypothetical protein [Candidatus Sigynarchaeota archaeon]